MTEEEIDQVLREIRGCGPEPRIVYHRGAPTPIPLRCVVRPSLPWNSKTLENVLKVTLPPDLSFLWNQASSLRLFEDVTYGQWGLILWAPGDVIRRHYDVAEGRQEDLRPGDLVIGSFLGDADLLMIRCDPNEPDFGAVLIVLEMDPRVDWPLVGSSLSQFLRRFVDASGDKFWEP